MDSRLCPRFPLQCPVTFAGEQHIGEGIVLNLSAGGWMIESRQPVTPGAKLSLNLELPDHPSTLEVHQADVIWVRGGKFGLKPISMGIEEWKLLRRLSATLQEASYSRF